MVFPRFAPGSRVGRTLLSVAFEFGCVVSGKSQDCKTRKPNQDYPRLGQKPRSRSKPKPRSKATEKTVRPTSKHLSLHITRI